MNYCLQILAIYTLLIINTFNAKAQTLSTVDLGDIESLTSEVSSNLFYQGLMTLYKDDQRIGELVDLEYRFLYYGFAYQDAYQPYNFGKETLVFQKKIKKKSYQAALEVSRSLFEKDPFNLNLLSKITMCYVAENEAVTAQIWQTRYDRVLQAILASGDGMSKKTAFVVNSGSDEKEVLRYLELEVIGQALEDYYEIFTVAQPNGKGVEKIYFCIKKPMEKLEELVGE